MRLNEPGPLMTFTIRGVDERIRSGKSAVVTAAMPSTFVSYVVASRARASSGTASRPTVSGSIAIAALF
jgi:hypothetical protein